MTTPADPPSIRWTAPPHPACLQPEQLLQQCEMSQTKRGGPGGQHRNKTSTTIVLLHRPSGIYAEASERRSQADNRRVALRRLRELLAVELRTDSKAKVEYYTIDEDDEVEPLDWPAMAEKIRKLNAGKSLRFAENNPDRAAVLALILDDLIASQGAPQAVAESWNTSSSQIVRFLKDIPEALHFVNRLRASFDLRPLR